MTVSLPFRQEISKRVSAEFGGQKLVTTNLTIFIFFLIKELRQRPEDWHNYLGMNTENYTNFRSKIIPLIDKQSTYTTMKFLLAKGSHQP